MITIIVVFVQIAPLFITVYSVKYGTIVPGSIAVLTGDPIALECYSDTTSTWSFNDDIIRKAVTFDNTLYIDSAKVSHSGLYKCYGNYPNHEFFIATARVFVGNINPSENLPEYLEVVMGQSFKISKLTSLGSYTPKWTFKNGPLLEKSYQRGHVIKFNNALLEHSGKYFCHYKDMSTLSIPKSYIAVVEIKVLAFLVVKEYKRGSFFSLTCFNPLVYAVKNQIWTFNNGVLPHNVKQVNNSLVFRNFDDSNEGRYACEGDTPTLYQWSDAPVPFAAVYILKLKAIGYEDKYGTIIPNSISILTGKSIVLKCFSSSTPQWTLKGKDIKGSLSQFNIIHVTPAKTSHSGQFQCQGTYPEGNPFVTFATVFVGHVNPAEEIPKYIEIIMGQSFSIKKIRRSKFYTPVWTFNNGPIQQSSFVKRQSIMFRHTRLEHAGIYSCYYQSLNKFSIPQFYVADVEVTVLAFKVIQEYQKGLYFTIECNIPGDYTVYNQTWSFNQGELPDNVQEVKNSLLVENFESSNEGIYACEGSTTMRYKWSDTPIPFVAIYILKLENTSYSAVYPSQQTTYVKNSVRFICDSQWVSKWTFEDGKLPDNAFVSGKLNRLLTIVDVQMDNQGVYKCSYFGARGFSVTDSGQLIVIDPGEPKGQTPTKVCPKPKLKLGTVKVYGRKTDSLALLKCNGLNEDGSINSYVRFCRADGTWSGSEPSCKGEIQSSARREYGSVCTFMYIVIATALFQTI